MTPSLAARRDRTASRSPRSCAGTSNNQYGDSLSRIKLHSQESRPVDWAAVDIAPLRKAAYGPAYLAAVAAATPVPPGSGIDLLGGTEPLCLPYDGDRPAAPPPAPLPHPGHSDAVRSARYTPLSP